MRARGWGHASKADAETKESDAQALYDKLTATKSEQKDAAESALLKLEKENGVKGMSRAEAADENAALKEQITDDEKYIAQVQDTMANKKEEWKDRSILRTGELAAISKAISILQSDDARDLFKKSIKSQGYLLLQVSEAAELDTRRHTAAHVLSAAAAGDRMAPARGHGHTAKWGYPKMTFCM